MVIVANGKPAESICTKYTVERETSAGEALRFMQPVCQLKVFVQNIKYTARLLAVKLYDLRKWYACSKDLHKVQLQRTTTGRAAL